MREALERSTPQKIHHVVHAVAHSRKRHTFKHREGGAVLPQKVAQSDARVVPVASGLTYRRLRGDGGGSGGLLSGGGRGVFLRAGRGRSGLVGDDGAALRVFVEGEEESRVVLIVIARSVERDRSGDDSRIRGRYTEFDYCVATRIVVEIPSTVSVISGGTSKQRFSVRPCSNRQTQNHRQLWSSTRIWKHED